MAVVQISRLDPKKDYQASEAYKRLRTNVQLCGSDKKVILLTSTFPNEGKSTTAVNLAVSFAENEKKVLFIDADLRKSVLAGRYELDGGTKGMSLYLAGQVDMRQIFNHTNISDLDMILAGHVMPNPAEMLARDAFDHLLDYARERYDYVIIDAPPINAVIDAAIIAPKCDGIVMVIAASAVTKKAALRVKQQLEKTGTPILGAILNKVENGTDRYYGKYYGK